MSSITKTRTRRFLSRKPRHVTNHEEARVHRFEDDAPNLRDQTSFGVGRAGIPG